MSTVEFKESLLDVYYGEQFGETLYATLLAETDYDNEKLILTALLQLETEGRARVWPFIFRYGLPARDNPQSISAGVEIAMNLSNENWQSKFEAMVNIKEQRLPKYEGLMEEVNPEKGPEAVELAEVVGAYDRVIPEVCENVIIGAPNPASHLADFLHFPIRAGPRLLNEENQ